MINYNAYTQESTLDLTALEKIRDNLQISKNDLDKQLSYNNYLAIAMGAALFAPPIIDVGIGIAAFALAIAVLPYASLSSKLGNTLSSINEGIDMIARGYGNMVKMDITYDYFQTADTSGSKGFYPSSAVVTAVHTSSGWSYL